MSLLRIGNECSPGCPDMVQRVCLCSCSYLTQLLAVFSCLFLIDSLLLWRKCKVQWRYWFESDGLHTQVTVNRVLKLLNWHLVNFEKELPAFTLLMLLKCELHVVHRHHLMNPHHLRNEAHGSMKGPFLSFFSATLFWYLWSMPSDQRSSNTCRVVLLRREAWHSRFSSPQQPEQRQSATQAGM